MKYEHLLDISLSLFDGGAAGGDGAGAAAPGADSGAKGDSDALPGPTRRGKSTGDSQTVIYGKQGPQEPAAAGDGGPSAGGQAQPSVAGKGKDGDMTVTSDTPEDKRKAFQALVNGEYKDIYTQETQRIIDRRFRETQNLEQQVTQHQPIIEMLIQNKAKQSKKGCFENEREGEAFKLER